MIGGHSEHGPRSCVARPCALGEGTLFGEEPGRGCALSLAVGAIYGGGRCVADTKG